MRVHNFLLLGPLVLVLSGILVFLIYEYRNLKSKKRPPLSIQDIFFT